MSGTRRRASPPHGALLVHPAASWLFDPWRRDVTVPQVRLTSLAHGGGCGCKLAPSVLQQLLAGHPAANPYRQLIVGIENGDDAAVWKQDDGTCIIATTD